MKIKTARIPTTTPNMFIDVEVSYDKGRHFGIQEILSQEDINSMCNQLKSKEIAG